MCGRIEQTALEDRVRKQVKIGTRSSVMALAQTEEIIRQLDENAGVSAQSIKFQPRGDVDQVAKLDRHGGKGGAFVAEIRKALRDGALDAAMHSLKDVPGDEEANGLVFGAYLRREAVEDALVLRRDRSFNEFAGAAGRGYKIGTNSVRRAAYIKRLFPECEVIHFRGAADTRIRKLDEQTLQKLPDGTEVGPADGLLMAKSGLARVGFADRISYTFSPDEMLPAVGQGIVVVECTVRDWETLKSLTAVDHEEARLCALAEREVLWILNGHCNTPIAGYATCNEDHLSLRAAVLSLDGKTVIEACDEGSKSQPRELGRSVGLKLLEKGAGSLISEFV
ncbi:MAG: hydroxymethylbilane synthase [Pseudomonadota bacterium]